MGTKVIFYKQDGLEQNTKFKVRKELFGLEQKSNFARYKYNVSGILNKIPYYKPVNSTIIVNDKDVKKIQEILDKYNVESEIFDINVPKTKLKK